MTETCKLLFITVFREISGTKYQLFLGRIIADLIGVTHVILRQSAPAAANAHVVSFEMVSEQRLANWKAQEKLLGKQL